MSGVLEQQPDRIITAAGFQGHTIHFFMLYTRTSEKALAEVLADGEFLRAYLIYRRLNPNHVVTVAELAMLLRHARVQEGVSDDALAVVAEMVNNDRTFPGPVQVAFGLAPVRGDDESVEFHVRPTATEARYETAQDGAIDYRELNLVQNCFAGQLIATRHPAREGVPGRDIHGRPIAAVPGRERPVRAGAGVQLSANGREYRALIDGRVVFENDSISVATHYEVPGDVDFRVGNIDFVGTVAVRGAVLDGFSVRGKEGVRIGGGVEGCQISSDKDVEIKGGVKGRGAARIIAGGNIRARYLDECVVECGGDVEVDKEIVNASVRAGRRILGSRATFVGGDAVAFHGLHLGSVGSPLGVTSRVGAGINWTDEQTLAKLDRNLGSRVRRLESAVEALAPFLIDKKRQARLTVVERALVGDLVAELSRLRDDIVDLRREREDILSTKREGSVPRLNVVSRAYPGVLVRFPGNRNFRFTEERRGPVAITMSPEGVINKNDSIVPLPEYSPPPEPVPEPEAAPDPAADDAADATSPPPDA